MITYEPYFKLWEACIPLGSIDQKHLIGMPCYKHKTCGHLNMMQEDKKPPVVCTWCLKNTEEEIKKVEQVMEVVGLETFVQEGAVLVPKFPYRKQV